MAGKMIVATGNRNKMIEIREILSDVDVEIVSMKEAGIHYVNHTVYELTYSCLIRLLGG